MLDKKNEFHFHDFTNKVAEIIGHPITILIVFLSVVIWLIAGFYFDFSDAWQLMINTITTIITFLMVFMIQHTQNRDTNSIKIKLDELIRAHKGAKNTTIDLDKLTDKQLKQLEEQYSKISKVLDDNDDSISPEILNKKEDNTTKKK